MQASGYELEIRDESPYAPQSAVSPGYECEYDFCQGDDASSRLGIICRDEGHVRGSAVLLAAGGYCGFLESHIAVHEAGIYVAVGAHVVCLELPTLKLTWKTQADSCTVFDLHLCRTNDGILVHGEIEISRLSLDGHVVWSTSGADIFTGGFSVDDERVRVEDFAGREYVFDARTGRAVSG